MLLIMFNVPLAIGGSADPTATEDNPQGEYGAHIKYMAIVVNTTLPEEGLGWSEGIPVMDAWEDYMKELNAGMPPSANQAFQTTPVKYRWERLLVQKELARNAFQGIVIGLILAFIVLTIATMNVVVGLLATLSITIVVVSVVGFIPLAGWQLGTLESLNLSLVRTLERPAVFHV